MRIASVSARSANFEALYGAMNGIASRPEIEPTNTSRPRAARSIGRNACATSIAPNTLISNWRRSSSTGRNSSGPATAIPALPTTPRNACPCDSTCSTAASIEARSVTSSRTACTLSCSDSARAASASLRTPA